MDELQQRHAVGARLGQRMIQAQQPHVHRGRPSSRLITLHGMSSIVIVCARPRLGFGSMQRLRAQIRVRETSLLF